MAKRRSTSVRDKVRAVLLAPEGDDLMLALQNVLRAGPSAAEELAHLAAHDPDDAVAQRAGLALFAGIREEMIPQEIREELENAVLSVIRPALPDRSIPDIRKAILVAMCGHIGDAFSAEEYMSFFSDPLAVSRFVQQRMEDVLSDDPADVETAMQGMGIIGSEPPEAEAIRAAVFAAWQYAPRNAHAAAAVALTAAAYALQHGLGDEVEAERLEAIADNPTDRSAWYFEQFARLPGGGDLVARVGEIAARMRAAGVTPRCGLPRAYSHGQMSMVDGAGSRTVSLFFRTPDGGMDAINLLLNDRIGIKDTWMVFGDGAEVEQSLRKQSQEEVRFAPCTLAFARDLVADAWAMHQRLARPFPGAFFIVRPYLGDNPVEPRPRQPDLSSYMLEMIVPSPALARGSAGLMDHPAFGDLGFASEAAYDFVRNHMPKRGIRLAKKDFGEFIGRIAPIELETLLQRMANNLEMEALAGRGNQPENQLAARTYVALRHGIAPETVEYVQALAGESQDRIINNLREGFTSQQQANDMRLHFDEELGSLMAQFESGWLDMSAPRKRRKRKQ